MHVCAADTPTRNAATCAQVWLDAHNVLIGSKDNSLTHIHTPTLQHSCVVLPQPLPLPPPSALHCGQHALAVR